MSILSQKEIERLTLWSILGKKVCLPYFLEFLLYHEHRIKHHCPYPYSCCITCERKENCQLACRGKSCEQSVSPLRALRVFKEHQSEILEKELPTDRWSYFLRLVKEDEKNNKRD